MAMPMLTPVEIRSIAPGSISSIERLAKNSVIQLFEKFEIAAWFLAKKALSFSISALMYPSSSPSMVLTP